MQWHNSVLQRPSKDQVKLRLAAGDAGTVPGRTGAIRPVRSSSADPTSGCTSYNFAQNRATRAGQEEHVPDHGQPGVDWWGSAEQPAGTGTYHAVYVPGASGVYGLTYLYA